MQLLLYFSSYFTCKAWCIYVSKIALECMLSLAWEGPSPKKQNAKSILDEGQKHRQRRNVH
uniref:Uncharacterized protein n=1 Tax=Salix viminalis TaxID=40686 RepID=A0A6N2LS76_SALVM